MDGNNMVKENYGRSSIRIGILSIAVNAVCFALKIWVGIAVGSIAMIADSWHTLSDAFTSVILIVGIIAASAPPDKEHPFGHGRAELIAASVIATILAIVGLGFFKQSVSRIIHPVPPDFTMISLLVFLVTGLFKEMLAAYSIKEGKRMGMNSLIADGWHHRSDAITNFIIIIGVFIGRKVPVVDGILGAIVSAVIIYVAWKILNGSASIIIGEAPDKDTVEKVKRICSEELAGPVDPHHIHMHRYGNYIEITMHIRVRGEMRVDEAHQMATRLEHGIKEKLDITATIHIEPRK